MQIEESGARRQEVTPSSTKIRGVEGQAINCSESQGIGLREPNLGGGSSQPVVSAIFRRPDCITPPDSWLLTPGFRLLTLLIFGRVPPLVVIARHQFVGRGGTPSSGRIVRKVLRRIVSPRIKDRLGRFPSSFNHIGPMKEGRITHHTIIQKFFDPLSSVRYG